MKIILSSSTLPIIISISGNIKESDLFFKIDQISNNLKNENIESLYENLYRIKKAADNLKLKIKASFLFEAAFFFFCKTQK